MMNNEEQIKVLQMVADGIVSIEEGEKLLDAIEDASSKSMRPPVEPQKIRNKWLRYLVIDEKSGTESVNLRFSANIFSRLFSQKKQEFNRSKDGMSIDRIDENPREPAGLLLNILGENDGKRYKLFFE